MTSAKLTLVEMQGTALDMLRAHWRRFVFQGVVMIVLGVLAVAAPVLATLAVDIYVGWLFLISGVLGLVALFSARDVLGFLWALVTALLSIVVGGLLLWSPVEGVLSLTAMLTAFFIVEGIFQAAAALIYRDTIPTSWGWMLVSGLADLALAAIIILGWPGSVGWVLGLLAGINLLTSGWAVVMVALGARDVEPVAAGGAKHESR
jgi:uncharacterized membrane protein HdeD (DUF308 family)